MGLTSLVFTDEGYLSAPLLRVWLTDNQCSANLQRYCRMLLRIALYQHPRQFMCWGLDLIADLCHGQSPPSAGTMTSVFAHNSSNSTIDIGGASASRAARSITLWEDVGLWKAVDLACQDKLFLAQVCARLLPTISSALTS